MTCPYLKRIDEYVAPTLEAATALLRETVEALSLFHEEASQPPCMDTDLQYLTIHGGRLVSRTGVWRVLSGHASGAHKNREPHGPSDCRMVCAHR